MGGRHYADQGATHAARQGEGGSSGLGVVAIVALCVLVANGTCLLLMRPALRIALHVAAGVAACLLVWAAGRLARLREGAWFAHVAFPVLLLGMGLAYLLFFPPSTVPDEGYHYGKSYWYANALTPGMDEFCMRKEDFEFTRWSRVYSKGIDRDFWEAAGDLPLLATYEGTVLDCTVISRVDMGVDPPQLKLPSAVGIVVGRALGLSGVAVYYLGRLFNLLFGVALIALAVRLAPVGKNVLMCVALLPMTLHLLGSYSYDAGIIGLVFVLVALLLRLFCAEGRAPWQDLAGTLLVLFLVSPGKVVYAFAALAGLFVPRERFSSRWACLAWKASLVLVPVAVGLAARFALLVAKSGATAHSASTILSTRQGQQGHFYTMAQILSDPIASAKVVLRTYFDNADFYITTAVGGSLGWLQPGIEAKGWQVLVLCVCLLASAVPAADDGEELDGRTRVLLLLTFVLVLLLVTGSMFVTYTFAGEVRVAGIQGRYFLPVLPCLLLSLRGGTVRSTVSMAPRIALVQCALGMLYLAQICFFALGGAMP